MGRCWSVLGSRSDWSFGGWSTLHSCRGLEPRPRASSSSSGSPSLLLTTSSSILPRLNTYYTTGLEEIPDGAKTSDFLNGGSLLQVPERGPPPSSPWGALSTPAVARHWCSGGSTPPLHPQGGRQVNCFQNFEFTSDFFFFYPAYLWANIIMIFRV